MSLNIIKYYLTHNRCYQRNVPRVPIGIQLHTIGTGQGTAKSVADYWNQSAVSACVTYIVDCDTPGKVLQCLPEYVRTWADGGYGNNNLITFEICESDYIKYTGGANYTVLDEAKFKADIMRGYQTAVELCADICKRYGWDPHAKLSSGLYLISSHDEGRRTGLSTAHVDPAHIWSRFGLTMDSFRAAVKSAMTGNTPAQPATDHVYRVRKTWTDVKSQRFAGTLDGAKNACLPGYSVYNEDGKCVYTAKKTGFQAEDLQGLTEAEKIVKIAQLYVESMKKTGLLASVGIAQFCLESGYGTTDLARFANNLHGMKCQLSGNTWGGSVWDGKSKYGKYSPEVYGGVTKQVYSEFRKYPCCEDSIADRAAYFTNAMNGSKKRYAGLVGETNYKKAAQIIKSGGYATDPDYVSKICSIIERFNLFEYDDGVELPEASGDILPEVEEEWLRVGTVWKSGKCHGQVGAYHDLEKAKKCADSARTENKHTYYVFDAAGKALYTAENKAAKQYIVQAGSFTASKNADTLADRIKAAGFSVIIKGEDGQYKVQCGSFEKKKNADALAKKLRAAGFAVIVK